MSPPGSDYGDLLGFVAYLVVPGELREVFFDAIVSVVQRRKIATRLVKHAVEASCAAKVHLIVRDDNATAISFYEQLGLGTHTGERLVEPKANELYMSGDATILLQRADALLQQQCAEENQPVALTMCSYPNRKRFSLDGLHNGSYRAALKLLKALHGKQTLPSDSSQQHPTQYLVAERR